MATWMTHFRIADGFIDIIGAEKLDLPCFIFGNIAPDCGVWNNDEMTYTPSKDVSHFGHSDNRDYKKFIETYWTFQNDLKQQSFFLGYYLHLLTDELWALNVYRLQQKNHLFPFVNKTIFDREVKKDWYDQDKLFIKNHPDFRSFKIFARIKRFPNQYLDFFPDNAFDWQLGRIRDFYLTPGENLEREYPYLTESAINEFIQSTIEGLKDKLMLLF